MSRLFISHSSKNNAQAIGLRDWLDENGWGREEVFLDIDPVSGFAPGDRWQARLKEASHRCEAVLLVISPAWAGSRWCNAEFLLAKTLGKKIFGVIVEPTPFETMPAELLAEHQLVDLSASGIQRQIEVPVPPDDARLTVAFHAQGLARLKTGLEKAGINARSFPFDQTRPIFRGLRALEEKDAAIFFGREGKIVEALDALRSLADKGASKFFVILGASGAGKSSFLRAGLWPRLARDDRTFLTLPVVRPERAALTGERGFVEALVGAATALGIKYTRAGIETALKEPHGFRDLLCALQDAARAQLVDDGAKPPLVVLPIDQGEELFEADAVAEAGEFLKLVCPLVKGPLLILLCMRSDSFERLQHAPQLLDNSVGVAVFSLPPLPAGAFKEVIEGPVGRLKAAKGDAAIRLDPRLTDALLQDIGGESADALPLLAFVLERLHRKYDALTLEDYLTSNRLEGAITDAIAEALKSPGAEPQIPKSRAEQHALLRRAFIPFLARIAEAEGKARRRPARLADLPADTHAVVDRLVQARVLVKHQSVDSLRSDVLIEIAHEALLRNWPELAGWLNEERAALTQFDELRRSAIEWNRNNRREEWRVHVGRRFGEASALAERPGFRAALDQITTDYLNACSAVATKKEMKERRALFASHVGPLIALILILALQFVSPFMDIFEGLRNQAFDSYQRSYPRPYVDTSSRYVDIDDESLKRIGPWPWPRTVLAALTKRLRDAGAAVIVFDMLFPEPDRTSPDLLANALPGGSQWETPRGQLAKLPNNDAVFADTLKQTPAVLGFTLIPWARSKDWAPMLKADLIVVGDGKPAQSVPSFHDAVVSLDVLQQAAPGSGFINIPFDDDGIVRRVPLFFSFKGRLYPSLALEALRVAQRSETGSTPNYILKTAPASEVAAGMDPNRIISVKVGAFEIPSTGDGQMWVRYADVPRKYSIPAWKILEGAPEISSLEGAAVFIGTSAAGLLDLRATPMNPSTPGVEVHVQAFEQMLLGDFLERSFWTRGLELAYGVAAALAVLWLLARGMPATAVAVGTIGVLFAMGLSVHAFANWKMLLDPIAPMILIAAASIAGAIGFLARARAGVQWVPPTIGRVMVIAATSAARAVHRVIPRGGDPRD